MEIPQFSEWMELSDYKSAEGIKFPGVYILAHYTQKPTGAPTTNSKNIIYVGETTKQTIAGRLYQFTNSAFFGKPGHSGGWTYSDKFLNNSLIEFVPENLFVSILPVDREENESKAYIKLVERLVIWEFFKKNKSYPSCNKA